IGGDTINEFVGTGLAMSGNSLTASLGTTIDTGEITDGTITGDDINSNIAGNGLVLTAASPDTLDVGAGYGLVAGADNIGVASSSAFTWTGAHSFGASTTLSNLANNQLLYIDPAKNIAGFASSTAGKVLMATGTAPYFSWETDATGITSLGGLTGTTQTFATSTETNLGLSISSAGSTHTFTPIWIGTLGIGRGGTGTSTTPTNGQLLIGNSTGYSLGTLTTDTGISVANATGTITLTNTGVQSAVAGTGISVSAATGTVTFTNTGVQTLTGTANQITVSSATGTITLSTPQSIGTGSSPTFAGATLSASTTLSNLANNQLLYIDPAKNIAGFASSTAGKVLMATGTAPYFSWETAAGGSGISTVEANNVDVVTSAVSLDFLGADFDVALDTGEGSNEADVAIDYTNSGITRKNQNEAITGDWSFSFAATEALDIASDLATAGTLNVASITGTPSATNGTIRGLAVINASSVNANGIDTGILVDNADDSVAIGTGISITSSGGGAITTAIDLSATAIGTGISLGANDITGTTAVIDFTNFDVSTAGNITVAAAEGLDTNAAGALELGKLNATSIDFCNSTACDTVNIANLATTDADTINIGDNLDSLVIDTANFDVTSAGAVTLTGNLALSGDASEGVSGGGLVDCDLSTQTLQWDSTTNKFSCGTDDTGGGGSFPNGTLANDLESLSSSVYTTIFTIPLTINETNVIVAVLAQNTSSALVGIQTRGRVTQSAHTGYCKFRRLSSATADANLDNIAVSTNPADTAQTAEFVTTVASTEVICTVTVNGTAGDFTKVAGSDLAEIYYTKDLSISPGDVVSIDGTIAAGVKKSAKAYDPETFGIISTRPGLLLGDTKTNTEDFPVVIALAGRVSVKASTENGAIQAGDLLTSSPLPGVAMKATKAGPIIGQALTSFDGEGVGTVIAFVKNNYSHGANLASLLPGLSQESAGNSETLNFGKTLLTQFISQKEQLATSVDLSEIFTDRVGAALEIITPKVTTQTLTADYIESNGENLTISLAENGRFIITSINPTSTLEAVSSTPAVISFDALGNAFFAGDIQAGSITANKITGLEFITSKISLLTDKVEGLATAQSSTLSTNELEVNGSASILGSLKALKIITDEIENPALLTLKETVAGLTSSTEGIKTELASSTESISKLDLDLTDLKSRIDTLETNLANVLGKNEGLALDGVSILDGALKINKISDSETELSFISDTVFFGRPYFSTDTAGFAVIRQGEDRVEVTFERDYLEPPIVNITMEFGGSFDSLNNLQYGLTEKTASGFTIVLSRPAPSDMKFNWIALAVKGARTFTTIVPEVGPPIPPPTPPSTTESTPTEPAPGSESVEGPAPEPSPEPAAESTPVPEPAPAPTAPSEPAENPENPEPSSEEVAPAL
ncbi:MAG: hypothetical protein HYT40_00765, partial [Candidatus Sungbacteria bacterium]|nr:hypothetical protein [Candidatus Sungbacteria bacterium]